MTVSPDQRAASPADPQASLRAELLGQVVGAQFELERALAEMPVAARAEGTQQLASLKALQRQIGSANPAMLHALRTDIATAVAIARAATQQGQSAATTTEGTVMLAEAASASREQVAAAMENMHRYDSFLQFGPGDSEADYRQREAERRRYVDAEQAKHTPTGDLNAAGGAMGQMVDAKAHGAGNSPEFKAQWDALAETTEKLRAQLVREGKDVSQFDQRLRDDLRTIMRTKGVADKDIDALFAAHGDSPLEGAKAIVNDGSDFQRLNVAIGKNGAESMDAPITTSVRSTPTMALDVNDVMAEFRTTGTITAELRPESTYAHGLGKAERPTTSAGRSGASQPVR